MRPAPRPRGLPHADHPRTAGHGLHARRRTRHCRATGPVRALHRAASACHARGRGRGARRGGAGEGGRRGCRRCWRAAAEVDLPRGRVLRLSRRVTRAVRARSASARPNLPKRALSRPLSQLAVAPLSSTAALPCVHFALERSSQSSHASASARGGTGDPARLGGLLPTGTPASAASSCPDRASAHCAAADGRGRAESGDVGAEVGEGAVRARTAATDVSLCGAAREGQSSTTSAMRCLGKQSFALGGQRQGRDAPPRAFGTLVLELPRRSPPSERVRQCTVRLARSSRGICGWRRAKEWVGEGVVGRAEGGVAAHGEARRARWFRMAVGRRRRVRKCERVCASVEGGAERGQRA